MDLVVQAPLTPADRPKQIPHRILQTHGYLAPDNKMPPVIAPDDVLVKISTEGQNACMEIYYAHPLTRQLEQLRLLL